MLLTCWNNFTKLRLGRLDRLDRLGWCRAGALGAPLAQSLPRRETTAVCFCPGTYPIWALKILINMWYNRNMNMSKYVKYVIIEVHTHHFFIVYTITHKYVCIYAVQFNTPSKSILLQHMWCNPRGSRGQNVVLHHRHSAPHVLLNAFQGLSSKKTNRKKPIVFFFLKNIYVFIFFHLFSFFSILFHLFSSFLIPRLICPSFLDKTLTDKSWYGSGRWHFSPSGLFAISIMELTVNFRNGLQHARAIRFLSRTLFATYFKFPKYFLTFFVTHGFQPCPNHPVPSNLCHLLQL